MNKCPTDNAGFAKLLRLRMPSFLALLSVVSVLKRWCAYLRRTLAPSAVGLQLLNLVVILVCYGTDA
jgi:hypothetical protein